MPNAAPALAAAPRDLFTATRRDPPAARSGNDRFTDHLDRARRDAARPAPTDAPGDPADETQPDTDDARPSDSADRTTAADESTPAATTSTVTAVIAVPVVVAAPADQPAAEPDPAAAAPVKPVIETPVALRNNATPPDGSHSAPQTQPGGQQATVAPPTAIAQAACQAGACAAEPTDLPAADDAAPLRAELTATADAPALPVPHRAPVTPGSQAAPQPAKADQTADAAPASNAAGDTQATDDSPVDNAAPRRGADNGRPALDPLAIDSLQARSPVAAAKLRLLTEGNGKADGPDGGDGQAGRIVPRGASNPKPAIAPTAGRDAPQVEPVSGPFSIAELRLSDDSGASGDVGPRTNTHTNPAAQIGAVLFASDVSGAAHSATPDSGTASAASSVSDARGPLGGAAGGLSDGRAAGAVGDAAGLGRPAGIDTGSVESLARVLSAASDKGEWRVALQLDPPELGRLHIHAAMNDGALTLRVRAQTAAAQEIVASRLDELRSGLREQGIRVERAEVFVRSADGAGSDTAPHDHSSHWESAGRGWEQPAQQHSASDGQPGRWGFGGGGSDPGAAERPAPAPRGGAPLTWVAADGRLDLVA